MLVATRSYRAIAPGMLDLTEGETLVMIDEYTEDWWTVRNAHGEQGKVHKSMVVAP